jgi:tetrahydromethanopterin S-methyltransferase subunit G
MSKQSDFQEVKERNEKLEKLLIYFLAMIYKQLGKRE